MAITVLGRADSADGTWQIDYDTVGLTVGHTCTSGTKHHLLLTIIRVATFKGLWSPATTYAQGDGVAAADGRSYTSRVNGNLNHDPVGDGGVNWLSTTTDVSADLDQGRVVDITGIQPSEVPVHVKGTAYPFLFAGTWTP